MSLSLQFRLKSIPGCDLQTHFVIFKTLCAIYGSEKGMNEFCSGEFVCYIPGITLCNYGAANYYVKYEPVMSEYHKMDKKQISE